MTLSGFGVGLFEAARTLLGREEIGVEDMVEILTFGRSGGALWTADMPSFSRKSWTCAC